jgi:hypothetical protein
MRIDNVIRGDSVHGLNRYSLAYFIVLGAIKVARGQSIIKALEYLGKEIEQNNIKHGEAVVIINCFNRLLMK